MKYLVLIIMIVFISCGDDKSTTIPEDEKMETTCEIEGVLYDNEDLPYVNYYAWVNYYFEAEGIGLDLRYINLNELPNCVGNLNNIKILNLHSTLIKNLPESFGKLKNLEYLDIGESYSIENLPESFGNLKKLKYLDLGESYSIKNLPESFGKLINLEYLLLDDVYLSSLPSDIGNLTNLKYLDLDNNSLSSLPISISNLKDNLEILRLSGSNFSDTYKSKVEAMLPKTNIYWD